MGEHLNATLTQIWNIDMTSSFKTSPYLKSGRLADVLAALQVMGAGERPEGKIARWADVLSRSTSEQEIRKWKNVFTEHPEFFLVYVIDDEEKAALRLRYEHKFYDPKHNKEYTYAEKEALPVADQYLLTTKPLAAEAVRALMDTAIELQSRAIAEFSARKWWVPILAAGVSFVGALLGALLGSHK